MTAGLIRNSHRLLLSVLVAACAACGHTDNSVTRTVHVPADARAVNQLAISGNACGPAALLNSMRFADARWQASMRRFVGASDRAMLSQVIREHGMRPSPHLGGRPRWNRRGINVADLTDIANELFAPQGGGGIRYELLAGTAAGEPGRQLALAHRRIERSLRHGIPPVLSVRRFAKRNGSWGRIDAHFFTITGVTRKLPPDSGSFVIQCIDPWGAKRMEGRIHSPREDTEGFLVAELPQSKIGKPTGRADEPTYLAASAVIGRF